MTIELLGVVETAEMRLWRDMSLLTSSKDSNNRQSFSNFNLASMSRKSSPAQPREEDLADEYRALQSTVKKQSTVVDLLKFVPFALITSLLCVGLYITVGGVDYENQIPYIAVAYVLGVIGLTYSYANVAKWVSKQRSIQKRESSSAEGLWFTLFYNNAFYIFLLLLFSSVVFCSLKPSTSMILTQAVASLIPAWISSIGDAK